MLIAISGGSGSGKTTIAQRIQGALGPETVEIIPMDAYYVSRDDLPYSERRLQDYDCPDSIDLESLRSDLLALEKGIPVDRPVFDFEKLVRSEHTVSVPPRRIILLEGLFCLGAERIASLADLKVFLDAPNLLRLRRRVARDSVERGRTAESVKWQWDSSVRAGYDRFVEPSKTAADLVIDSTEAVEETLAIVLRAIRSLYRKPSE